MDRKGMREFMEKECDKKGLYCRKGWDGMENLNLKRTAISGELKTLKGFQCICGLIYGLTDDIFYLKDQEISYIRCELEHKGILTARLDKQYGGYTNLEIKSLAKSILNYNLILTVKKDLIPRCVCSHIEKYHYTIKYHLPESDKIILFQACNIKNCKCKKYQPMKF